MGNYRRFFQDEIFVNLVTIEMNDHQRIIAGEEFRLVAVNAFGKVCLVHPSGARWIDFETFDRVFGTKSDREFEQWQYKKAREAEFTNQSKPAPESPEHGVGCKKEPHSGDGYLHDANSVVPDVIDDAPVVDCQCRHPERDLDGDCANCGGFLGYG